MRRALTLLAALAVATASFVPVDADARDRRGGYYDGGRRHHHYRDRDDDGDALAAGAVGLVLGLALGSMASRDREPQAGCYDNYRRCAPPPRDPYYEEGYYEDERYYEDQRYDDRRAYQGGGYEQCWITEERYDRYEGRTVTVRVPC